MGTETKTILSVNTGSSSIKLDLFAAEPIKLIYQVDINDIGQPNASLTSYLPPNAPVTEVIQVKNHRQAVKLALEYISKQLPADSLLAIGHRIVHGGHFMAPTKLTDSTIKQLHDLASFDPEHMPVALEMVEACTEHLPGVTQVACFDTMFYKDMPKLAKLLPLPRRLERLGLKRYGFHGLVYESLINSFKDQAGYQAANGRIILANLGSGVSLTAVKGGEVLDTTMAFTPSSGVMMSSRSGDIDPGIISFLSRHLGVSVERFNKMINFESGLLGVSELSADMELLIKESSHNTKAADAVDLFCYQVRKAIGSFTAVLGGLDSLIFAGGMGERAPVIRAKVCDNLDYLGIKLSDKLNQNGEFLISTDNSQVGVHVMHADEASVIVRHTKQVISQR